MALHPSFPPGVFRISEDREARAVLLHLGALNKIEQHGLPDGRTTFLAHKDHPTHWILAARLSGNDIPSENGYVVWGWPKDGFPFGVVMEHVRMFTGGGTDLLHTQVFRKGDEEKN